MQLEKSFRISKSQARSLWLRAQRLDSAEPFGAGPEATQLAVEHLGYVQIDTINVIERCHHHILFSRIPSYQRRDLYVCQAQTKSVFEYWTHALSYVPTRDLKFYIPAMKAISLNPGGWLKGVTEEEYSKVIRLIKNQGPISIRDIEDDVLVEKNHPWASRKPSKKALQLGFYTGELVISERVGMLKKYELAKRHFGWERRPKPASENEILNYTLDRALRSQALVSLDSICHLRPKLKPVIRKLIASRMKRHELIPVVIDGIEKIEFWTEPRQLEAALKSSAELTHILSPFDPLIILRHRLKAFFEYEHRFEAYLPKDKRVYGYFALPVLIGDQVVAALDLKTDRSQKKLLIQKWTWLGKYKSGDRKTLIEQELGRFEKFQLGN